MTPRVRETRAMSSKGVHLWPSISERPASRAVTVLATRSPARSPIYQSTTWKYDTSEHMGRLFDLEESGYFYTRLQNPTNDAVAAKICELEGGTAAMLTSSGQAANFFAVFNIAGAGDHVVASSAIYGGTYNLLAHTMKRMGLECTFVAPDASDDELEAAFRPNTKAVFGETIANPALAVLDIERFAKAAHAHGVPLIVDNTFPTPVNCRPIEWGADIVTHSTTKYMDGHGAAVGGAIVDSGNFDWMAHAEKFPGLTTPDETYHGVTYAEKFGQGGAFITKATAQLMRDFGCIQSPQNAFLLNLGLESLHVRMPQHCKNGQAMAEFLAGHPAVRFVRYPGLPGDDCYDLAQKYLPNGSCGVVSFGFKGGRAAAEQFMKSLKIAQIVDACGRCAHLLPAPGERDAPPDERRRARGLRHRSGYGAPRAASSPPRTDSARRRPGARHAVGLYLPHAARSRPSTGCRCFHGRQRVEEGLRAARRICLKVELQGLTMKTTTLTIQPAMAPRRCAAVERMVDRLRAASCRSSTACPSISNAIACSPRSLCANAVNAWSARIDHIGHGATASR